MSKYDVNKFKQVTVALNTPFQPDGSVDLKAVRAVVNYFYNKGIRQMYVCGSTGEGFLLDTQERMAVTETVVEEAAGRMNIIVHVGCPDTRQNWQDMLKKPGPMPPLPFHVYTTAWARKACSSIGPRLRRQPISHFSSITSPNLQALTFPWTCSGVCWRMKK